MPFEPPKPSAKIAVADKDRVLKAYLDYYRKAAKSDPAKLRIKLKRSQLQPLLDEIGKHVADLAKQIGDDSSTSDHGQAVRKFLKDHPIPGEMATYLTTELRAYAILVRALLNWAVGQSLAIDRWALSGNARRTIRSSTDRCVVTDLAFGSGKIELHHPMRDGRPPIPVSASGHKIADDVFDPQDAQGRRHLELKTRLGYSWRVLWQGCLVELGESVDFDGHKNPQRRESFAAAAARRFSKESSTPIAAIRQWIEENELVPLEE